VIVLLECCITTYTNWYIATFYLSSLQNCGSTVTVKRRLCYRKGRRVGKTAVTYLDSRSGRLSVTPFARPDNNQTASPDNNQTIARPDNNQTASRRISVAFLPHRRTSHLIRTGHSVMLFKMYTEVAEVSYTTRKVVTKSK